MCHLLSFDYTSLATNMETQEANNSYCIFPYLSFSHSPAALPPAPPSQVICSILKTSFLFLLLFIVNCNSINQKEAFSSLCFDPPNKRLL